MAFVTVWILLFININSKGNNVNFHKEQKRKKSKTKNCKFEDRKTNKVAVLRKVLEEDGEPLDSF